MPDDDHLYTDERNPGVFRMLQDVHAFAAPLEGVRPRPGEVSFPCLAPPVAPPAWKHVREDVRDFFRRMHCPEDASGAKWELRRDPRLPAGSARATVTETSIRLEGGDLRGLWRAVAWMEHEMAWRHAAILPRGEHSLAPRYDVRITTSTLARGLESFRDPQAYTEDYLRSMAHYGYSAFFVYCDLKAMISSRLLPELNAPDADAERDALQDLTRRAARYGLEVFLLPAGPRLPGDHPVFLAHPEVRGGTVMGEAKHALCSSSPRTRAFYAEQMTQLGRLRPAPGGWIFIIGGEGFLHCYTRPNPRTRRVSNCPVCSRKSVDAVLAPMLNDMTAAIRKASTKTRAIYWPYASRIWQDKPAESYHWDLDLGLIERLDPRSAWLLQYEQDDFVEVEGVGQVLVYDYSIQHIGPSPRFTLESAALEKRGLELVVKTETTQTIELHSLPYIPVMQRWAARHRALRGTAARVCMDTWRLNGFWQAPSSELAWWYSASTPPEDGEILRRVAARLYGAQAVPAVLAAWDAFSEAWETSYARYGTYWDGPLFLGPAHPFDIGACHLARSIYSDAFYHHSPGLREHGPSFIPTDPWRRRPKFHLLPGRWAPARIRDYGRATEYWRRGMEHLSAAWELTPAALRPRAQEDIDMAAMVGIFLQADVDHNTFTRLRDTMNHTFPADPAYREMLAEMDGLLERNLALSREALERARRTPFLGWGYTFGMRFNAAMISEKIRHTERLLDKVRGCLASGESLLV